jgi:hypothetical protein
MDVQANFTAGVFPTDLKQQKERVKRRQSFELQKDFDKIMCMD